MLFQVAAVRVQGGCIGLMKNILRRFSPGIATILVENPDIGGLVSCGGLITPCPEITRP
jgi:hypothetical protein